jgi:hypothetical protein
MTASAALIAILSESNIAALLAPLVIGVAAAVLLVPMLLLVSLAFDPTGNDGERSDSTREFPAGAALRLPRG